MKARNAPSPSRGDVPQLAIARVSTAGGPYDEGDLLSIAFTTPSVCRIVRHDGWIAQADVAGASPVEPDWTGEHQAATLIPDMISISIVVAAMPYSVGSELTLSFLDPKIARIHSFSPADTRVRSSSRGDATFLASPLDATCTVSSDEADARPDPRERSTASSGSADTRPSTLTNGTTDTPLPEPRLETATARRRMSVQAGTTQRDTERTEVHDPSTLAARTRLVWTRDRAHRFVQVCDRLFTVERLGWYRHAFAMRLLLPDEIACGHVACDCVVADQLDILTASAIETLGRPMLAAFMPSFSVTSEWLDSLDDPAAARALSRMRATLMDGADTRAIQDGANGDASVTEGAITLRELTSAPGTSVEALLPLLIANVSPLPSVTEKLTAYRAALTELFGQTAGSAEPVRLSQMALPNHTLDDRLWHLVGVVSDAFVDSSESRD